MTESPKEPTNLPPKQLAEVVAKLKALRSYSSESGFRTTKSQNAILSRLSPDDLATVLLKIAEVPATPVRGSHSGRNELEPIMKAKGNEHDVEK